ncbi:MAG: carboxypeptidase-like regulatory domain-containing protein, partial [Bacteroidaceae bacterium]
MKRIVLFYLLVLSCCSLAIAQNITVQGKVIDENHEAIPFANIVLVSAQDTTNILQGTSTNLNGVFTLKSLDKAAYVLRISFLGYKTNIFPLNLQATKKKLVSQTIVLLPDVVALNEVVVAGKRSIQSIDKTAYTFSMEQMAKAGESRALVATLPNLHVDKASNGLKSINGKSVMILINGVKATDADLRLIPADKIKKVDYYDVPPIRYMNDAEIVINVH